MCEREEVDKEIKKEDGLEQNLVPGLFQSHTGLFSVGSARSFRLQI